MPDPSDDVEARLAVLEREVARLREQAALISSDVAAARVDAAGARVLAAGADRDVSEVRAELRAHGCRSAGPAGMSPRSRLVRLVAMFPSPCLLVPPRYRGPRWIPGIAFSRVSKSVPSRPVSSNSL